MHEYLKIFSALERGGVRAANFDPESGEWIPNVVVKSAILSAFKEGRNVEFADYPGYIDKHSLPPQKFSVERGVRLVPGGSSVRCGAYVASGVIIMPPSFINVGAYIDEGTMVDSHVLVGSCAQIGKRVHLSAGVQIGGVLEPVGARPVVIEDDVFVGAGAIIVEGMVVKQRAVIAAGVILSKSVPIYDLVKRTVLPAGSSIPEEAVVVPGERRVDKKSEWAKDLGLGIAVPIIIKYRDSKSELSLQLEDLLR